jgi:hypothetical protein
LLGCQSQDHGQNEHQANPRPIDNGSKGIKEINAFNLFITSATKSTFEFSNRTIRIAFAFERPSRWEDMLSNIQLCQGRSLPVPRWEYPWQNAKVARANRCIHSMVL